MWPLVVLAVLKVGTSRARRRRPRRVPRGARAEPDAGRAGARGRPPPRRRARLSATRRGRVGGASTCSSPSPASGRWPRRCSWPSWPPTATRPVPYYGTDTRAQALLVGAAIAIGLTLWPRAAGVVGSPGAPRCWRSPAWPGRLRCGARRRRRRRSPSAAGSSWRACRQARSCSGAPWPALARRPPPRAAAAPAVGSHLLRRVPLVLAGAAGADRAAAALGRLPAVPGPRGHHGRHRRPQLRPRRDADPPRRAAAVALVDRRADRRGRRDQRRLRQHAGAGGGERAPGFPAERRGGDRGEHRRPRRARPRAHRRHPRRAQRGPSRPPTPRQRRRPLLPRISLRRCRRRGVPSL